jgi:hypothetical protein
MKKNALNTYIICYIMTDNDINSLSSLERIESMNKKYEKLHTSYEQSKILIEMYAKTETTIHEKIMYFLLILDILSKQINFHQNLFLKQLQVKVLNYLLQPIMIFLHWLIFITVFRNLRKGF